jgi:hypothetical protein
MSEARGDFFRLFTLDYKNDKLSSVAHLPPVVSLSKIHILRCGASAPGFALS